MLYLLGNISLIYINLINLSTKKMIASDLIMPPPVRPEITTRLQNIVIGSNPAIFDLKEGDIPNKRLHSIYTIITKTQLKYNKKFTTRRIKKDGNDHLYVWRLT